jgi:hypothetical protein
MVDAYTNSRLKQKACSGRESVARVDAGDTTNWLNLVEQEQTERFCHRMLSDQIDRSSPWRRTGSWSLRLNPGACV